MLQCKLTEIGIANIQCSTDSDRTIVTTAMRFTMKPARQNEPDELYSSKSLEHLPSVQENILLLHAITGCDTVSATFGRGKIKFFNTFPKIQT